VKKQKWYLAKKGETGSFVVENRKSYVAMILSLEWNKNRKIFFLYKSLQNFSVVFPHK
jgi:hypothetical protein